jgi:SNF2 family DNA or RNA helicase
VIILHLSIHEGRSLLWGETPAQGWPAPYKRRGRRPKNVHTAVSPFNTTPEQLFEALAAAGIELPTKTGGGTTKKNRTTGAMNAWLPSLADRPVGSSPLISEQPTGEAVVQPWGVSTLHLPADKVVDLLAACAGGAMLTHGVLAGDDLLYWAQTLRFAGALATRGRFLPGVHQEQGSYHARWEPVILGDDLQCQGSLAARMPAACCCLATAGASQPPAAVRIQVLTVFIASLIDTIARREAAARPDGRPKQKSFASVHEQWIAALASEDGLMTGPDQVLSSLASQVDEWRRRVSVLSSAPFRFCFRLEEPLEAPLGEAPDREEKEIWAVRYLLQDVSDPSLLVPVSDVWTSDRRRSKKLPFAKWQGTREFLLTALGQAACLCEGVAVSLKTAVPAGFSVYSTGAYEFLTVTAPLLEQAGFGVMLPAWWTDSRRTFSGDGPRLAVRARAGQAFTSNSRIGLDQVVDFNWEVALDGEALTDAELAALAKAKAPLVMLRGRWVEVNARGIRAAIDFWEKQAERGITARQLARLALGASRTPDSLPLERVSASGWMAGLLDQLDGKTAWEELLPPLGLQGRLRPYQVRGYSWLNLLSEWGLGACLADDMGLGKTVQTLSLIQRRREQGEQRPALLICPTSVIGNWQREAARFTPDLPLLVHHGGDRTKGTAFKKLANRQAMVLSSYALLARDQDLFQQLSWSGIILDEAQNIKNPQTRQAQAARALTAECRIALTGTPVENNVGDLWSLMEFLNPGLLGNRTDFQRSFLIPVQVNRDAEAVARLKRLTAPFVLRRLKTDRSIITDLPEKIETKAYCPLTREQGSLYKAVVNEVEESLAESTGIQRRGLILAALSKLKQVCNHPAQFLGDRSPLPGRSGKLNRLVEMCEELLAAGERALVFTQFAGMGELLQKHLVDAFGREVLFLHGGVTKQERDRLVELFQQEQGPPFFVLSLKAGGTGLNLTGASHVFHFDRWWNPAVENQATDRAFRIGQVKNVQVHKFVCTGTIEERIDEMIEHKLELAEQVVGSGEGWLTELSTEEIRDLMALREEAIAEF